MKEDFSQQISHLKFQDELKLATTIFAIARESNRSGYLDYELLSLPATSYRIFRAESVLSEGWIDDK
jgi:hypothetical protein